MGLIGICGKMGSGKDLTGSIVEYLTGVDYLSYEKTRIEKGLPVDYYLGHVRHGVTWETRKFADKLKQIVCILINCSVKQLEDREFKEKELGEEWNSYKVWDSKFVSARIVPFDTDLTKFYDAELIQLTPRLLLQLLGTECGRQIIHPDIWVNALFADYNLEGENEGGERVASDGGYYSAPSYKGNYPNWIITDLRFPNEVKAIKDRGGIVIRKLGLNTSVDTHLSEKALDDYKADYEVPYCENIEDLITIVKHILIKEKIL